MKISILVFILLLCFENLSASRSDSTRKELLQLLKNRNELFNDYNASLVKKSGLFGNKTKTDLRDSQDKLMAVVAADNKIMSSLNRTLNFRDFEKQTMSYDVSSYEKRIRNLSVLNDTLNSQYLRCTQENKILNSTVKRHHLYIASLILLIILTGGAWMKKSFFN